MVARDTGQSAAAAAFRRVVTPRGRLYALIDAGRCPEGPERAEDAKMAHESLLAGSLGRELGDVAPYLVEFRDRSSFGEWWFEQWGRSIGVLVEAPVTLGELRRHFRTLLVVRHEDRRKYFFRFYDPRVLRVFLPNTTAIEVKRFFGPVSAFYCEGQDGRELLTYRQGQNGVSVTQHALAAAEPSDGGSSAVTEPRRKRRAR